MLLGSKLKDKAYLSADTRVTYSDGRTKDNIQKIEFLPKHNLIIAAAGGVTSAAAILKAIDNRIIDTNSLSEGLGNFLKEITHRKSFPANPLKDVAMIFHGLVDGEIYMKVVEIKRRIGQNITYDIIEHSIKNGQYVAVGGISGDKRIEIDDIPAETIKKLENSDVGYDDYALATDKIFETIKNNSNLHVGGKTISVKTFIDTNGNYKYVNIPGIRTIIYGPDEHQDVSMITRLEPSSGKFYLRDIRNDGRIITNMHNDEYPVRFQYDSCPKNSGSPDMYYVPFSEYDNKNMDLELKIDSLHWYESI